MSYQSFAHKLESYRYLIFNSKDAQIAPLLDAVGVDSGYLDRGEELYNQTKQLVDQQKKEYQESSLAYDSFYVEKDEAEANYQRTYKLVKVLSRNDNDLQNRLGLQTDKVYALEEWITGAVDFYKALQNENGFLTTLAKFKLTPERISEESKAIADLLLLRNKAETEKGGAQAATQSRNQKLDELADYCIELKAIAEIALESNPQLLEKLGVLVRS